MWLTAFVALLLLVPAALIAGRWEDRRQRRRLELEAAKHRHPAYINQMRRREGRD